MSGERKEASELARIAGTYSARSYHLTAPTPQVQLGLYGEISERKPVEPKKTESPKEIDPNYRLFDTSYVPPIQTNLRN